MKVPYADDRGHPYASPSEGHLDQLESEAWHVFRRVPCTRRVREGEDARAGRWAGRGKTECGLHG